jgi:uncharacterized phage protein gp47/JayE
LTTTPAVYTKKPFAEIVQNVLDQITQGISREKHVYEKNMLRYQLASEDVKGILKVRGYVGGKEYVFENNRDVVLAQDTLEWLPGGQKPDEGTPFEVTYKFDHRRRLTDTNTGSVLRTLVEAMAREMEFLYLQLDKVYQSGFIDSATGNSLDLVVSILGIHRKKPTHAMGSVTFWRNRDPEERNVNDEGILYDGKDTYDLREGPIKGIVRIRGSVKGKRYTFGENKEFVLDGNSIRWLQGKAKPDERSVFTVDYVVFKKIVIPAGTAVSTNPRKPENKVTYVTTEGGVLEKVDEGLWECTLPVKSTAAGEIGNVPSGFVVLMPKPVMDIEGVTNRADIRGGAETESDEELRKRAKKALEVAGKATPESLRVALEGIEGIQSPPLIEEMPDGNPGIVRAVVDGGDTEAIKRVIEETRAAGIKVEFERPKIVTVDVDAIITVIPKEAAEKAKSQATERITKFLGSLKIGTDIVFNRLIPQILAVPEIDDVVELVMTVYKEDGTKVTSKRENIAVAANERVHGRTINVKVLEELPISSPTSPVDAIKNKGEEDEK